jgi:hypothetical protein
VNGIVSVLRYIRDSQCGNLRASRRDCSLVPTSSNQLCRLTQNFGWLLHNSAHERSLLTIKDDSHATPRSTPLLIGCSAKYSPSSPPPFHSYETSVAVEVENLVTILSSDLEQAFTLILSLNPSNKLHYISRSADIRA